MNPLNQKNVLHKHNLSQIDQDLLFGQLNSLNSSSSPKCRPQSPVFLESLQRFITNEEMQYDVSEKDQIKSKFQDGFFIQETERFEEAQIPTKGTEQADMAKIPEETGGAVGYQAYEEQLEGPAYRDEPLLGVGGAVKEAHGNSVADGDAPNGGDFADENCVYPDLNIAAQTSPNFGLRVTSPPQNHKPDPSLIRLNLSHMSGNQNFHQNSYYPQVSQQGDRNFPGISHSNRYEEVFSYPGMTRTISWFEPGESSNRYFSHNDMGLKSNSRTLGNYQSYPQSNFRLDEIQYRFSTKDQIKSKFDELIFEKTENHTEAQTPTRGTEKADLAEISEEKKVAESLADEDQYEVPAFKEADGTSEANGTTMVDRDDVSVGGFSDETCSEFASESNVPSYVVDSQEEAQFARSIDSEESIEESEDEKQDERAKRLQKSSKKIYKIKKSSCQKGGWNHLRGTVFKSYLKHSKGLTNFQQLFKVKGDRNHHFSIKGKNSYFLSKNFASNPEGFIKEVFSFSKYIHETQSKLVLERAYQDNYEYYESNLSQAPAECFGFTSQRMKNLINQIYKQYKLTGEVINEAWKNIVDEEMKLAIAKYVKKLKN